MKRGILTYPDSKPVWGRLFKYLKSLFGSLMEAVKEGTKLKYVLDFIKEYIECLDASVKFRPGSRRGRRIGFLVELRSLSSMEPQP